MEHFPHTPPNLTKNQSMVMAVLSRANEPLSAYSILDQLRGRGLRAPLQIYRALDKLVEFGMVHRLESMNAFVACRHPDCESETMVAFIICGSCGEVSEIPNDGLDSQLQNLARSAGFHLKKSTVELFGECKSCV